jgi:hypothetical protein
VICAEARDDHASVSPQFHFFRWERIGDAVETRQYQKRIAAETTVNASKSDGPRGEAFRAIAGYIFGAH